MELIQTVVVDDSLLIREGVVRLLEFDPGVEVIATCAGPGEALRILDSSSVDVVLTDIRMPPTQTDEGIALARELATRHPTVGVVVLSQHVSAAYAIELLGEDPTRRGYLLKDRLHDVETLGRALRAVAAGGCYVDPLVVESLANKRAGSASSPLAHLTPREREILADIAEGANNQAIADRRFLTRRAVEKHASAIFQKLGLGENPTANRRVTAVLMYLAEQPR